MNLASRWNQFFDRPAPNMILRLIVMLIGLAFVAASVALTRASGLGTSPISCIPAVLSFATVWSIGVWTFLFNVLLILIQVAILRRNFQPIQWLQVVFVFVFSAMIDLFVPVCNSIPMPNYGFEFFYMALGCFMTAFGIFLQVKASILTLPGEGVVLAIASATKLPFPKLKVAFDTSQTVIGAAISLFVMGGLFGVREGTIISALFVGIIIALFNRILPIFDFLIPLEGHKTLTAATLEAPSASAKAPVSTPVAEEEPVLVAESLDVSTATSYLLERD